MSTRELEQELAALREQSDLYQAFMEFAPDAILIADRSGKIQFINTQATSLFGYSRDELKNMVIEQLMPERFRERHVAHRDQYRLNPSSRKMGIGLDLFALTKDGREIPIDVSFSPVKTPDAIYISVAVRDISEHKQAEAALRTAKKKAEGASLSTSRFLAAAGHDLRQPLQSLHLYISVLSKSLKQSDQQQIMDKIDHSLQTINEVLDSLLDISRLKGGSITPSPQDFPVQALFDMVVAEFAEQAKQKQLTLKVLPSRCEIHSDPGLLQRVVVNFVGNAIHYTDAGEIVIRCESSRNHTWIKVSDSGRGIPKQSIELIFDEYVQLNNPARDRKKGLGLGLSVVKYVANLLGHRINVDSAPGKGSTFAIEVPLAATATRHPLNDTKPAEKPKLEGISLLFVDNEPMVIDAIKMLLDAEGIPVTVAGDVEEAMVLIVDGLRPDVIVSDYRLPKLNGSELVKRIRDNLDEETPAIIVTGDTSLEAKVINLSNCQILSKPVDSARLIQAIERAVVR